MDPRRLVLYYAVMTLFLLALAAGAYQGLQEVSREADATGKRLEILTRLEDVRFHLLWLAETLPERRGDLLARIAPAAERAVERLRGAPLDEDLAARAESLAALSARALADPADPGDPLREALAGLRFLSRDLADRARGELRDRADRPAAERARTIYYGSLGATLLGSAVFTALFLRALRERRAAEDRMRRSEVLAGLGALAAGVAHEVNNPLGTIAGSAEAALARLEGSPPNPDRAAAHLRTIAAEAARCAGIVDGLKDLARDGPAAVGPVDLGALVRETAALAAMNPRLAAIPVEVAVDEATPLVLADAPRLKQAVLNLLANAVEASPAGAKVEVTVGPAPGGVAVEVRDHGPGVPARDRRRIFEPFRTARAGGLGLGLAVVDRVAAAHGGSIEVHDAPGGGARFVLRIPRRPAGDVRN